MMQNGSNMSYSSTGLHGYNAQPEKRMYSQDNTENNRPDDEMKNKKKRREYEPLSKSVDNVVGSSKNKMEAMYYV